MLHKEVEHHLAPVEVAGDAADHLLRGDLRTAGPQVAAAHDRYEDDLGAVVAAAISVHPDGRAVVGVLVGELRDGRCLVTAVELVT